MDDQNFDTVKNWLADAPLFIDGDQIERFYDAVVRPQGKVREWTVAASESDTRELMKKIELGLEADTTGLMKLWVDFKGKLTGGVEHTTGSEKGSSLEKVWDAINTPQRQLILLTDHYRYNLKHRSFYVTDPTEEIWRDPATISDVPRGLVFLDLPGQFQVKQGSPQTKLIPMAAEFESGRIVPIFFNLRAKDGRKPPPEFPESQGATNPKELEDNRNEYWEWFGKNFDVQSTVLALEEAASTNGRIRWIDFRIPITGDGKTLHLHISPAGHYDTGVFAYNLIRRGFEFGLRIVGTMKSDPDMDVLAIYDK